MKYLIGIMLISLFTSCGGESKMVGKKDVQELIDSLDAHTQRFIDSIDADIEEMQKEHEKWMQERGYSDFSNQKSNDWRNQSLKEREKEREKQKKEQEKWMKERGYTVF